MPAGNGTGPVGMGPMTGRSAGYCAGFNMPGYANPVTGRGFGGGGGRGFGGGGGGFGRGRRNMFMATGMPGWQRFGVAGNAYPQPDPAAEAQALNSRAAALETELEAVKQCLNNIKPVSTAE